MNRVAGEAVTSLLARGVRAVRGVGEHTHRALIGLSVTATLVGRHRVIASPFVWKTVGRVAIPIAFTASLSNLAAHYLEYPQWLWSDARIYFRATEAWVAGGNPWAVRVEGISFGAPPPTLLLNLPFLWMGETAAVVLWVVASAAAVAFLLRSFRLPWWWVGFYPITEGFVGASPDLLLAALILVGWGWLSGFSKLYAIPAMLAYGRWRSVLIAGTVGLVTIPFLPWGQFLASQEEMARVFALFTTPVSALGSIPLLILTTIALISLGARRGLALTTPGLLAQQPHYVVFSLDTIAQSRILTLAMTIPIAHVAALGVIAYAVVERLGLSDADRDPGERLAVDAPGAERGEASTSA